MPRYLFQGNEDSAGRVGPTLQKLADRAEYSNFKRRTLENLFETAAPAALYSPEAEASWAGVLSKTANIKKLEEAQKLLAAGKTPQEVWKATGWGKSPEGKWMYEISDDTAKLRPDFERLPKDKKYYNATRITDMPLGGVLQHPQLQKAYPELFNNTRVDELKRYADMYNNLPPTGSFKPGPEATKYYPSSPNRVSVSAYKPEDAFSVLMHEVGGHGTAKYEKFHPGSSESEMQGSINLAQKNAGKFDDMLQKAQEALVRAKQSGGTDPIDGLSIDEIVDRIEGTQGLAESAKRTADKLGTNAFKAYQRNAGEANARLVQSRLNMTPEQRLNQYPWEPEYFKQSTGVSLEDLIK